MRKRKPTVWQARWARWHRPLVIVLFVVMVLCAIFVSLGIAALLFAITLGLATFGGGTPTDNGNTRAHTFTGS